VVFGFLAGMVVAWFSRQREFRADHGSAQLMGQPNSMINALARLGGMHAEGQQMPQSLQAMGIVGGIGKLFASHPPMEERIAALKNYRP
jgi:heat shock protein HtpX